MKKQVIILFSFFLFCSIISCKHNIDENLSSPISTLGETEAIVSKTDEVNIFKVSNVELSAKIKDIFTKNSLNLSKMANYQGLTDSNIQSFDFDNIYKTTTNGAKGEAFVVNYKGNTALLSYALVIYRNDSVEFLNPMLVKTVAGKSVDYGLIDVGFKVTIDKNNGDVKSKVNSVYSNKSAKDVPCGEQTARCIQDAYSNHGWASVYIFAQTLFLPQTGAAIAIACAAHCLD